MVAYGLGGKGGRERPSLHVQAILSASSLLHGIGGAAEDLTLPNVHTPPFRFDDFSKNALVKALWLREYGLKPKEQTITLNVGETASVTSTMNRLRAEHGDDIESQNISAALQADYIEQLGSDDPLAPPSVAS